MTDAARAYVYAILVDGVVRYIGKGQNKRLLEHARIARAVLERRAGGNRVRTVKFYNRLAKAIAAGSVIQEVILIGGLTEDAAFEREKQEIAAAPDEQLWNTLDGGQGWSSRNARAMAHRTWAQEDTRAKRLATLDKLNRDYWQAPENKERRAQAFSQAQPKATERRWGDPSKRERWGQQMRDYWATEEARARGSEIVKGFWKDPAYLEKMRNRPSRGPMTPEQKKKLLDGQKAYWERKRSEKRIQDA